MNRHTKIDYHEAYAEHELELLTVDAHPFEYALKGSPTALGYSMWRMAKKGTNNGSCVLMFTPNSVTIVGDWIPVKPATTTLVSKGGLKWFSKPHTPNYLVPHFLERGWSREKAIQDLSGPDAAELFVGPYGLHKVGDPTPLEEALETLEGYEEGSDWSGSHFFEYLTDIGAEPEDAAQVGMAYDPDKRDHLVAIHAAFLRSFGSSGTVRR